MTVHKKTWKGLQPNRFRKNDYADRIEETARLLAMAASMLWADDSCPDFGDKDYRDFVLVEILHGDQWRRNKTLHTLEDAKRHVLEVYHSHRKIYNDRIAAEEQHDGIDRRITHTKDDLRTVKHKGVNFKLLGDIQ